MIGGKLFCNTGEGPFSPNRMASNELECNYATRWILLVVIFKIL